MFWQKLHNILLAISFANIRVEQCSFIRYLWSPYYGPDFETFSKVTERHMTWCPNNAGWCDVYIPIVFGRVVLGMNQF